MRIIITLAEAKKRCNNWSEFCKSRHYKENCVEDGLGSMEITLNEYEAKQFGII